MVKANVVCFDFDKTLCVDDKFGEPNKPVVDLMKGLWRERYEIIIHTCRGGIKEVAGKVVSSSDKDKVYGWLEKHGLNQYVSRIIFNKPEAVLYVDDRATDPSFANNPNSLDIVLELSRELLAVQEK